MFFVSLLSRIRGKRTRKREKAAPRSIIGTQEITLSFFSVFAFRFFRKRKVESTRQKEILDESRARTVCTTSLEPKLELLNRCKQASESFRQPTINIVTDIKSQRAERKHANKAFEKPRKKNNEK